MGEFCFVVLSDAYGAVQVSVPAAAAALAVKVGDVARARGAVALRPPGMANPAMATGEVEIVVGASGDVECVGRVTEPLPLPARARAVGEVARLAARHLDLRTHEMQRALRLRSRVVAAVRGALLGDEFVEVETPTLFRSTPEGAREFLVPTRTRGRFYALAQSPQQYKQARVCAWHCLYDVSFTGPGDAQLLMVGGLDRYFQVARCYRDEGGRADRQPEFTQVRGRRWCVLACSNANLAQIDLEMSFVIADDVMTATERVLRAAVAAANASIEHCGHLYADAGALAPRTLPLGQLPRMTYSDAMSLYGVDKPDRRIGMPIVDVTATARGLPRLAPVLAGGARCAPSICERVVMPWYGRNARGACTRGGGELQSAARDAVSGGPAEQRGRRGVAGRVRSRGDAGVDFSAGRRGRGVARRRASRYGRIGRDHGGSWRGSWCARGRCTAAVCRDGRLRGCRGVPVVGTRAPRVRRHPAGCSAGGRQIRRVLGYRLPHV